MSSLAWAMQGSQQRETKLGRPLMKNLFVVMLLTLSVSTAFAGESQSAEDCEATRHSDERNTKETKEKTESKDKGEGAVSA
jgi:hypothetical protein